MSTLLLPPLPVPAGAAASFSGTDYARQTRAAGSDVAGAWRGNDNEYECKLAHAVSIPRNNFRRSKMSKQSSTAKTDIGDAALALIRGRMAQANNSLA